MGCDYYADENGGFEMIFFDYETGAEIARVAILDLKPGHQIGREIDKGRARWDDI